MAKVTVYMDDGVTLEYEGKVDVAMGHGNAIIITERVPNVTGKGEAEQVRIKALVNPSAWLSAEVE